jgi:hypothetical protein
MRTLLVSALFIPTLVLSQAWNTFQAIRPGKANAQARISSGNVIAETTTGASCAFKCNESSGNLVDSIASVTLTPSGTPTYSIAATGIFSGLNTGVGTSTGPNYFVKNSATTQLNFGTSDITFEGYFSTTTSSASQWVDCMENVTDKGWRIGFNNTTSVDLSMKAEDGSANSQAWTTSTTWNDGVIHKIRIGYVNSTAIATLWIDGVSQGTLNYGSMAGKTVNCNNVAFGANRNGSFPFNGTTYLWRLTVGSAVYNIGGPGGG